jgi:hypothetical protein
MVRISVIESFRGQFAPFSRAMTGRAVRRACPGVPDRAAGARCKAIGIARKFLEIHGEGDDDRPR